MVRVAMIAVAVYALVSRVIYDGGFVSSWLLWLVHAVLCGSSAAAVIGIYVLLFERKEMKALLRYAKNLIKKKTAKGGA